MIIIKSQDGLTLVKCKEVIANECKINNKENVWRKASESDVLGTYATKERAQEVIKEITEELKQCEQRLTISKAEFDSTTMIAGILAMISNYFTTVYEMPKE